MPRLTERISLIFALLIILAGIVPRFIFFLLPPGEAENMIGEVLVFQFQLFLTILGIIHKVILTKSVGALTAFVALLIMLLRLVNFRQSRKSGLPPESALALALVLIFSQFFFDLSQSLLTWLICLATVFMATIALIPGLALRTLLLAIPLISALTLLWLDWADSAALLIFGFSLVAAFQLSVRKILSRASCSLLVLSAIPAVQLFSAWLPSAIPYSGGRRFTPVMALSFCESHSQNVLLAVHPQCPMAMFSNQCRDGYIGVYDRQSLEPRKKLQPFDDSFYGRPEQIICHNDKLFVGMNAVRMAGEILGPNTLLLDIGGTKVRYWRNFGGANTGNHLLYDAARDALFLTAEFGQQIFRWDFKAQKMETHIGDQLPNPWLRWLTGTMQSGSLISHHDAISEKRATGYFSEWINGRFVHELDLVTLKAKRHFRFNAGASVGTTVDDTENRLWVTHLWGVSVFDLSSGQLLFKHRTGFISRPAVIDKENNLVFMASTVRGRISVFDRKTLQPVAALALGIGSRYLYISPDTHRLYASSWSGSYAFDLGRDSTFVKHLKARMVKN